jgi:pyruvate formate lyase activating enzyme
VKGLGKTFIDSNSNPIIMSVKREAEFWKKTDDGRIECVLCPHHCKIPEGGSGLCRARANEGERLAAEGYGIYPAVHMDPIEKKPLNHFLPGSSILSLGSVGCNLTCLHCQNWSLARGSPEGLDGYYLPVEDRLSRAKSRGSIGVAFTYNEPTINYEYLVDAGRKLKEQGSRVVLVTNGYLESEPWDNLMKVTDAANVDVKGYTEDFYKSVTGGSMKPVLRNVKSAFDKGVHMEIAYLVIPGHNDDGQVEDFIEWVRTDLSPEIPVHFNRFHPDHRMQDVPPTPPETLTTIKKQALKKGLVNVFIGNLVGSGSNDTVCPSCGKVLVSREGFWSPKVRIKDDKCPKCGKEI